MEKIWKLLSNFEEIENGFWKEFQSIKDTLGYLQDLVEVQNCKIDELENKIAEHQQKELTIAKACQVGFIQVRDAMHVLREDLAESSGTIISETWND